MIDTAFGTNFSYMRETGSYNIPNGVISRYSIIASGQWTDPFVSDRGFAWAQIDLPHPTPTWHNPTQLLDETRFISDCVIRFAKSQALVFRTDTPIRGLLRLPTTSPDATAMDLL